MRNRVSKARSLVLTMVVSGIMLLGAGVATAQESTLESRMPMNIAGPVGIAVAAVGLTGLLLGLWRHRRKTAKARVQASPPR